MERNIVKLSGKVVSIRKAKTATIITICTTSIYKGKVIPNFPRVIWRLDDERLENIQLHDKVFVTGELRGIKKYNEDGTATYPQSIYGISITPGSSMTDEQENEVVLSGIVTNVYAPSNKISYCNVKVSTEAGRDTYVLIRSYGNVADFVKNQVQKDDNVTITGRIQTTKYNDDNDKVKFDEYIVADKFVKI